MIYNTLVLNDSLDLVSATCWLHPYHIHVQKARPHPEGTSMPEKSYVALGHQLCPVCGAKHDTVVLLDKRLYPSMERDNILGLRLCAEHAAMSAEYVALVEVASKPDGGRGADLTGNAAQLRWEVASKVLNAPLTRAHPFVFVEPGVIAKLKEMAGPAT